MSDCERTLVVIKPDRVSKGCVGEIIKRFEEKGLKLLALKLTYATKEVAEQHYARLSQNSWTPGLLRYITSSPVIPMVWEGQNGVKIARNIVFAVRDDMATSSLVFNILHGADSVENAQREIKLWLTKEELIIGKKLTDC